MQIEKKEITISAQTKQRAESAKLYIERRYTKLIQQEREKRENWELLYKKMQQLNISESDQEKIKNQILHREAENMRLNRKKISISDYQSIKIIGRGAFGEVRLCKSKQTGQPVAIKKMKKSSMINKNKVIQAREQKDILAISDNNAWIVNLQCAFQDQYNLYLVMQYLPGGDLMNLLIKKDIFTEEQAKFYIAQILMALNSVHELHYIHRDLKPDNILIDKRGHIKLSDFGLCKHTEIRPKKLTEAVSIKQRESIEKKKAESNNHFGIKQNYRKNRKLAYSTVGTPDYVAPQVQGKNGYGEVADWWSLGIIFYEMLVGYPPFVSESSISTWYKIINWRKFLFIPKEAKMSNNAIDLIRRLICDEKDRLGLNGVKQIMDHPFFKGIQWNKIREKSAPYIPNCKNLFDTHYFDNFQAQDSWQQETRTRRKSRKDPTFIGYTYRKKDLQKSQLLKALLDFDRGNFYFEIDKKEGGSLDVQKMSIDLTQFQRKNLFRKDKTESSYQDLPQIFSAATINIRSPSKKYKKIKFKDQKFTESKAFSKNITALQISQIKTSRKQSSKCKQKPSSRAKYNQYMDHKLELKVKHPNSKVNHNISMRK